MLFISNHMLLLPTTLYSLFRELDVSGEEKEGEGDTDGGNA
jgi:hypothetical protein